MKRGRLPWRDWSLATTLSVLFALLALVPLASVSHYNGLSTRTEMLSALQSQGWQGARGTAEVLDMFLTRITGDIRYLALDHHLVEALRGRDEGSRVEAELALRRLTETHGFDSAYLTDQGGNVLVASDRRFVGRDYVTARYFLSAIAGQTSVDEPRYDRHDGAVYLHFSAPVRVPQGAILGTVIGRTTMAPLDQIVAADSNFAGQGSFGVLWDESGIRLSHGLRPDLRFKPFAPPSPDMAQAMIAEERFGPATADLLADDGGTPEVVRRSRALLYDRDADPYLHFQSPELGAVGGAVAPLSGRRWFYGVFTPEAAMLDAVDAQSRRAALAVLASGLLSVLVGVAVARRVSRPIHLVAETARALAGGDMARRTGLKRRDEVGRLAAAFDGMADALAVKETELRDYAEHLEQRVEARTREIRRLNRLYRTLSEVNQAVVRIRDRGQLLREVCRIVVEHGSFPLARIALVDEQTGEVVPAAHYGIEEGDSRRCRQRAVDDTPGAEPTATALRTGDAFVSNSIEGSDGRLDWYIGAWEGRYLSAAAFPLRSGDRVVGALSIYAGEPQSFGDEDVRLLGKLAADLSFALESMENLRRLEESETRFRSVVETATEAIVCSDSGGKVVFWNLGAEMVFGYSAEEMAGRPVALLIAERFRERHGRGMERLAAMGEAPVVGKTIEGLGVRKDGAEIPVELCLSVWRSGQAAFFTAIVRDISERQRAAESLRQSEEQLRRAQRLETAGRVAAQVAHDFNNLLVPLTAYPDLIKMQLPEGHPAVAFCDSMLEAARQMATINEDLLTLGRRANVGQEPVDLNLVVEQAVAKLSPLPDTLGVEVRLAKDLLPVGGSPAQLLRVIYNLLANARDSLQGRGVIAVSTENVYLDRPLGRYNRVEIGGYARVVVRDTGCGIPPEIHDKIFDAFFTTKRAGVRRGSGLGLSIVQAIVEDHRGYIDLESEVGKGTTFNVYLPFTPESMKVDSEEEMKGGNETVLLVDDDPLQREVTGQLLRALGYRADTVASGEEAVAYLLAHPVDLLILDMVMPGGIDGAETYRRVREVRPGQRAILMSGFAETERVREAQALGVGTFLRKPAPMDRLARVVREELDRERPSERGGPRGQI